MPTFTRTQAGHHINQTYCSKKEQAYWETYFETIHRECRESLVSELVDINSGRKHRLAFRIAKVLRSVQHQPFVFISCLN